MDYNPLATYKATLELKEFKQISSFISDNYGIKLPDHKRVMIQGRLLQRLIKLKISSFEEYTKYVFSVDGKKVELQHMIDAISTNKTEFFREAVHFDFLKAEVLPNLVNTLPYPLIKVWSTAASSGEEAYSIAMIINDFLADHPNFDYSIQATDISMRMLEQGKKAIYQAEYIKNIPLETKRKYFLKNKDPKKTLVRVQKELRKKVSFSWLNLMDKEYPIKGEFDIIFCRNVLIYFSKENQFHVLQNLKKKLKPGGYLFLGHSESIVHMNTGLKSVSQTVFQKQ